MQRDAWGVRYGAARANSRAGKHRLMRHWLGRPVTGVGPNQVGVAWPPANDSNPVVQAFARCCLDNKPPA